MYQSSVPWTNAAIDPCLLSIEQETYTQEQLEEAFAQTTSNEPVFTQVVDDDLDGFDFSVDNSTHSHTASADPSTSSTPDFSSYTFTHPPSAYQTAPSTPQPYPIVHQPVFNHHPLPFRAQPTSPFALPQPPQGYDRIAPPHPTFIRLQGAQAPRVVSYVAGENARPGPYVRHGRSVSQGPSQPGRRLKNTIPYSLPGSPLVGATHIGTPIEEGYEKRKRVRPAWDVVPYLTRVTDPARLRRSRHIIEIGAMAVRKHADSDEEIEGLMAYQRVVRKVGDVEEYLKRKWGSEDALKGCGVIREALARMGGKERGGTVSEVGGDAVVNGDDIDVPSKMMDSKDGGIFDGGLGKDDIMGLLMRDDEVLGGDRDDI